MAFSRLLQVNVTVGGTVTETTLASSVSYNGVTFTFDRAMPVGEFVTGEPFVVSDQAFGIVDISPASADIHGDGHFGHGAMKNPAISDSQGFDGYIGDFPNKTSLQTPYSAALNIDPANAGAIQVSAGERASFVKSVRVAAKTSNTAQSQTVDRYVTLTVLDQAPPPEAFRPGMSGTEKRIRTRADVSFTPRGLAKPASWPSVATILADVVDNIVPFTSNSERRRFFRTDESTIATTGVSDGYSRDITPSYARFIYLLNCTDISAPQRQYIIDRTLTFAGDIEAALDVGIEQGGGAGQGGGLWLWVMAAAALTGDELLHQKIRTGGASNALTAIDGKTEWITVDHVGQSAWGSAGVSAQTFFDEHVGLPHAIPDEFSSGFEARYVETYSGIVTWEMLAVLAFDQGAGGHVDGFSMVLNGAANDNTNPYAAAVNWVPRWLSWNMDASSQPGPSNQQRDAWDDLVAAGAVAEWSGQPEQVPAGSATGTTGFDDPYFTEGDGRVTLNVPSGFDYATEAITQNDFRYSLDGVQWIEENDIGGLPYIKSGLLKGATHFWSWRRRSTSGIAPWSPNYPFATPLNSGSHRNIGATTGTQANAAPFNTVAPAICRRKYPLWLYPVYEAAAVIDADDLTIAAGVGYWSGFPAPDFASGDFTFQWQQSVDGSTGWQDITIANGFGQNANASLLARRAENAGKYLRCTVTCTTAQGAAMAHTNSLRAPALATIPAGTLIDTDFRGAFAIDYESELENAVASNGSKSHEPRANLGGGVEGLNVGLIRCDKSAAAPRLDIPLSRPAVAGATYELSVQLLALSHNVYNPFTTTLHFSIRNSSGAEFYSTSFNPTVEHPGEARDITTTFSIPGTESDLDLIVRVETLTGSSGEYGGDPALGQLKILAL